MRSRGTCLVTVLLALLAALLATPSSVARAPQPGEASYDASERAQRSGPADVVRRASIYRAKPIRAHGCTELPVPLDSVANVKAYYEHAFGCLVKDWARVVKSAGRRYHKPRLVVWTGESKTACGGTYSISFYCSKRGGTIYMYADEIVEPWHQYPYDESHLLIRLSATHTIAHEYGHHLQQLSGILPAYGRLWYRAGGSKRAALERRLELQASCLGNLFLDVEAPTYPIPEAMYADWRWPIIHVPNHGSEASQQYWITRGRESTRVKACNTFTASAGQVS